MAGGEREEGDEEREETNERDAHAEDRDRVEAGEEDGDEAGELSKEQLEELEPRVAWCSNAPLLYDLFIGCTLEWPALSVAWLPDEPHEGCRLALGMHTDSSEVQELIVAELTCSTVDCIGDDPWQAWSIEGLGDIEAFGCSAAGDSSGPLRVVARMAHPTEVNRVAPCPKRPQLLATKAATGTVLLFDYKVERPAGEVCPEATLTPGGEFADGFALDWSFHQSSLLATGGNDGRLCVWDVEVGPKVRASSPLLDVVAAHKGALGNLAFSRLGTQSLASVGDDGYLRLWDLRRGEAALSMATSIASTDVLGVDWSHHREHNIATVGKDSEVRVWDLRSLRAPVHSLRGHNGDVVAVRWAPFKESLLASACADGRLHLWDLASEPIAGEGDAEENASPELLFAHAGHGGGVSDFGWSDADDYLICSVSEDNSLHIWQPSAELYLPEAGGARAEGEDDVQIGFPAENLPPDVPVVRAVKRPRRE